MRVILFLCGGIFICSFILTIASYIFLFYLPEEYKILDILKSNSRALMFLVHFPSILILALTAASIAWSSKAQAAYQRLKRIKENANLFWFATGAVISLTCFIVFYIALAAAYFLPRRLNMEFSLTFVIINGVMAGLIIKMIPSTVVRTIDKFFRLYFYRDHYLNLHFPSSRLGLLYLAYKYHHVHQFPHGPKYLWQEQVNLLAAKAKKGDDRVIEHLLCWLKEKSIPGFAVACSYLRPFKERTFPFIIRILKGDDLVWKYIVLNYLLWGWPPDVVAPISPLLIELTQQDDKKKVNLIATWILCQNKLCNEDQIQKILNRLKGWYPDNQDEIEEIEDYLKEESSQAESDDFTEWD